MIVLGLDTTGAACSVSLVDEATVLAHESRDIGRGHAEVLAQMVADALTKANLTPNQIDRIAVCTGPGGFTGLRVALSFAIGFAMPRDIPVVGIDALEVTAQNSWISDRSDDFHVYRDVRRNEVMFAQYLSGQRQAPPASTSFDSLKDVAAHTIESISIDTRILAWLAMDRDPANHPPEPLYARGPDAKLPGGKSV
jgi:tRNA threonylcarbamoyl adenosine modification protein YeaZ